MFPYLVFPPAPADYNLPPTVYSLLEAIVNYGEDDKKKIKELAKYGRSEFFDFDYPLTTNISKEEFECMILNHFLMRRIGYDTLTAFKIALNVKLNEVMPIYNKMFDMLEGWNLFNSGEVETRTVTDSGQNSVNATSTTSSVSDRRYNDAPQNRLVDVQSGEYVSEYNYDTDTGSVANTSSGTDSRTTNETITRTPADKIKVYKEFMENKTSIYTMIFKDLDPLFYGLV